MKTIRTLVIALTFFLSMTLHAWAGDPSGTWKFKADAPKGRSLESTLTLNWDHQQLTGTIENAWGQAEISRARFADDQVSFTVTRKIRRRAVEVNYSGKLVANTITGTISTLTRENKLISLPWQADRVK